MSTCYFIASERQKQVRSEFAKTKSQISDGTKQGRHQLLNHLSKLYRKVEGRDRRTLKVVGSY